MARIPVAALAVLTVLLERAPAAAQPGDRLRECMDHALDSLAAQGGRLHGEPEVGFLRPRESRSFRHTLERPGCVGFLALGQRGIDDLDLLLHTDTGLSLVDDVGTDSHPYVRYCGGPGLSLMVTVHVYAGQGEFRLARIDGGPATLPEGVWGSAGCFAPAGGIRRPAAEIGPEPPGPTVDEALAALEARLAASGWRSTGSAVRSQLGTREAESQPVPLQHGRCYAVSAVGGPDVVDLDLALGPEGGPLIAQDESRARDAMLKVCVERPGSWRAEVRMSMGQGAYALVVYELDEPRSGNPMPGVTGSTRIPFVEVRTRIAAHGMTPRPLAWGMLLPGQSLNMPVRLEAGRCYAFGGVPSQDLDGGDLDLMLLDEREALVAWDVGRDAMPVVWHCPARSGTYRVAGRVFGARGRYLVLVGESP